MYRRENEKCDFKPALILTYPKRHPHRSGRQPYLPVISSVSLRIETIQISQLAHSVRKYAYFITAIGYPNERSLSRPGCGKVFWGDMANIMFDDDIQTSQSLVISSLALLIA